MHVINTYLDLLSKHGSRDRIMRLLAYTCKLLETHLPAGTNIAKKLALYGAAVNGTRAFTRFLDDIPMLKATLSYGLGKKSGDVLPIRVLQVLENLSNQLFFPCEHMVQFAKYDIFTVRQNSWSILSVAMWASSLFFGITKNIIKLVSMQKELEVALRNGKEAHSDDDSAKKTCKELLSQRRIVILTLTKSCCDFLNAIHFLPPGEILWSGKLTQKQSAVAGFVASLVGLYISLISR